MKDPGSTVFLGREGTGAATIYRPSINPLAALLQERRLQRANELAQRRLQQRDDIEFQKWIQSSFDNKYPIFQKPYFAEEYQKLRKFGNTVYNNRNQESIGRLFDEISRFNERKAKAQSIDEFKKQNDAIAAKDDAFNNDFLKSQYRKLWSKPIDDIDPVNDIGELINHPMAYLPEVGIGKVINKIDEQVIAQDVGKLRNSELGQYRIVTKQGARFGYYDDRGNPVAGITNNLIDHVLRSDPRAHQTFRYLAAKADHYGVDVLDPILRTLDDTPEILAKYQESYRFKTPSESPELMQRVRKQARAMLEQYQKQTEIDQVQTQGMFTESSRNMATTDDYKYLNDHIIEPTLNPVNKKGEITVGAQNAVTAYIGGFLGGSRVENARYFIGDGTKNTKKGDPYIEFDIKPVSVMGIPSPELSEPKRFNLKDQGTRKVLFEIYSTKRFPGAKEMNLLDYQRAIEKKDVLGIDKENPLELKND